MILEVFQKHPQFQLVSDLCARLVEKGFLAYLAGGCVRDALLGVSPKDFDVATNASIEQLEALFPKTVPVGKAFGVMKVVMDGHAFDVARFRKDFEYQDQRHPDKVEFCDAKEDALRRDFTINALFFDLATKKLIDYVGGEADLRQKLIRCVGDAELRFKEDALRILRALRFSARLGFVLEEKTQTALQKQALGLKKISWERIKSELAGVFAGNHFKKVFPILNESEVLKILFPELHLQARIFPWALWLEAMKTSAIKQEARLWHCFFQWVFLSAQETQKKSQLIKTLPKQLKFSRDLQASVEASLSWCLQPDQFQKMQDGEVLELMFEEDSYWGLEMWIKSVPADTSLQTRWQALNSRFHSFAGQKPEAFVKAKDLPQLTGAKLGQTLKLVYWAQLEGVVKDPKQALEFAKK